MEVCYKCGRRIYSPDRCPRCGLTFCEKHMPPDKHACLAVAEVEGKKRIKLFSIVEFVAFLVIAGLIWWVVNHR